MSAAGKHRFRIKHGNIIVFCALIWLFLQGLIVGSLRVMSGANLLGDFIQYLLLWGLGIFAFCVGSTFAQRESKLETNRLFAKFCIVELGAVFARVDVGFFTRSSAGFSFFLPFLVQFILKGKKIDFKSSFLLTLSIGVSVFAILFSGLRSVFVLGAIVLGISLFHFSKAFVFGSSYTKNHGATRLKILYLVLIVISVIALSASYEYWSYFVEIAQRRFMLTIFNADSFQLDPSEGRSREAEVALAAFAESGYALKEVFGLGFGFVFLLVTDYGSEWKAHVHITPVAYFVRLGGIGAAFWFCLFLVPILRWRTLRKAGVELWVVLIFYLFAFSSSFAGFLNLPAFWLLLGYISSIQVKQR